MNRSYSWRRGHNPDFPADSASHGLLAAHTGSAFHALNLNTFGGGSISILNEAAPFIHLVPLAPNRFNEAKSNCSWLEATAAGAMVIAPGFLPEFVRPGIRNYTTGQAFVEAVKAAMVEWRDGAMHPNVEISRKDIRRAGLLLSETNKVRWKIVKSLCRQPAPFSL